MKEVQSDNILTWKYSIANEEEVHRYVIPKAIKNLISDINAK